MKIRRIYAIVLILFLIVLIGCTDENYSENVVAVINGKTITKEEIDKELTERKMFVAIGEKIKSLEPNSPSPKEVLTQSFHITEEELNTEQIRYLESRERSTKLLDNNEAFNILLREEVFYQEALKQGHEVSIDKAKQILEESNKISSETIKGDEEALKKQKEITEYTNEIYKQYGFKSEEDYLKRRIERTAQAATISGMKNQFNKVITDKLSLTDNFQINIEISNAWDDYGEFLLARAVVKILNPEYSVKLYGRPWSYGVLDLRRI